MQVQYEGQSATLRLVVVKGNGPTLLGRNWLELIGVEFVILQVQVYRISWKSMISVSEQTKKLSRVTSQD